MTTKLKELARCDLDFLLSIARETNLSYRYYGSKNKSYILNLLSNRFNYDTIKTIVDMYLLCRDAYEVAEDIRPDGMEKIACTIPSFFEKGEYLYEVRVGRRICDIVVLKDEIIISIEIKSAQDNLSRVIKQLQHYQLWSDLTYLVYDKKHRNNANLLSIKNSGIGLLEYSNESIKEICKPKLNHIDINVLLNFMTYDYLRKISKSYDVKTTGNKKNIINRLNKKITAIRVQQLFKDFLRNKRLTKIR